MIRAPRARCPGDAVTDDRVLVVGPVVEALVCVLGCGPRLEELPPSRLCRPLAIRDEDVHVVEELDSRCDAAPEVTSGDERCIALSSCMP